MSVLFRGQGSRIRSLRIHNRRPAAARPSPPPLVLFNHHYCSPIATYTPRTAETALSLIRSNTDPSSADFRENAAQMAALTASLRNLHAQIALGGPEKARAKHLERNKMLPRE